MCANKHSISVCLHTLCNEHAVDQVVKIKKALDHVVILQSYKSVWESFSTRKVFISRDNTNYFNTVRGFAFWDVPIVRSRYFAMQNTD